MTEVAKKPKAKVNGAETIEPRNGGTGTEKGAKAEVKVAANDHRSTGTAEEPSFDSIKALLLGQNKLMSDAHTLWKQEANSWIGARNGVADLALVDSDLGRAAKVYQELHLLFISVWEKHVHILLSEAKATKDTNFRQLKEDGLQKLKSELKHDQDRLNKYYNSILEGKIGMMISSDELSKILGSEEERKLKDKNDDLGDMTLSVSSQSAWSELIRFFDDGTRAHLLKLFEKFLVQLQICHLFNLNLVDERNLFYRKMDADEDSDVVVPRFFYNERDKKVNAIKKRVEGRRAEIRGWMKYFEKLPFKYE